MCLNVTVYCVVLQSLHDNNPRPKGGPTGLDPLLIRGSAFAFLPGKPVTSTCAVIPVFVKVFHQCALSTSPAVTH